MPLKSIKRLRYRSTDVHMKGRKQFFRSNNNELVWEDIYEMKQILDTLSAKSKFALTSISLDNIIALFWIHAYIRALLPC